MPFKSVHSVIQSQFSHKCKFKRQEPFIKADRTECGAIKTRLISHEAIHKIVIITTIYLKIYIPSNKRV